MQHSRTEWIGVLEIFSGEFIRAPQRRLFLTKYLRVDLARDCFGPLLFTAVDVLTIQRYSSGEIHGASHHSSREYRTLTKQPRDNAAQQSHISIIVQTWSCSTCCCCCCCCCSSPFRWQPSTRRCCWYVLGTRYLTYTCLRRRYSSAGKGGTLRNALIKTEVTTAATMTLWPQVIARCHDSTAGRKASPYCTTVLTTAVAASIQPTPLNVLRSILVEDYNCHGRILL